MTEFTREQLAAYADKLRRTAAVYEARKARSAQMPKIMTRVFRLRHVAYMGYGFHHVMEASAGRLMGRCSPELEVDPVLGDMGDEIAWDMLLDDIDRAEESTVSASDDAHPERIKAAEAIKAEVERRLFPLGEVRNPDTLMRLIARHGEYEPTSNGAPAWVTAAVCTGAKTAAVSAGLLQADMGIKLTDAGKAVVATLKEERR